MMEKISFFVAGLFFYMSSLCGYEARYEDVSYQHWLAGIDVVHASYTWKEAVQFIKTDPGAIHEWGSDTTPVAYCSLVYQAPWGRIWSLGFFQSLNVLFTRDEVIPLFQENDYVLVAFWGEVPGSGSYHKALIKKAKYPQNFFFLGNSDGCTHLLRREGVQAFTVSHNAFINSDVFRPNPTRLRYDAVYAGCCRPQKRLELAQLVLPHLLVVTHSEPEKRKVIERAKEIVYSPEPSLIPKYISQARCGLILSEREGGCYASTEYLYCGIPVVSTPSIGGRDAYYDEITAIIVEPTAEGVLQGVEEMKKRAPPPSEIRRRALAVTDRMLNTLAYEIFLPIFSRYQDVHAKNPREVIDSIIAKSTKVSSKGRTVFQPEMPTHDRIEKIQKEQRGESDDQLRKKKKKR